MGISIHYGRVYLARFIADEESVADHRHRPQREPGRAPLLGGQEADGRGRARARARGRRAARAPGDGRRARARCSTRASRSAATRCCSSRRTCRCVHSDGQGTAAPGVLRRADRAAALHPLRGRRQVQGRALELPGLRGGLRPLRAPVLVHVHVPVLVPCSCSGCALAPLRCSPSSPVPSSPRSRSSRARESGLWRSADWGYRWQRVDGASGASDGVPIEFGAVHSILALGPARVRGRRQPGLFVSDDFGQTWKTGRPDHAGERGPARRATRSRTRPSLRRRAPGCCARRTAGAPLPPPRSATPGCTAWSGRGRRW